MPEPIAILVADKSAQCRRLVREAVKRAGIPVSLAEAENGRDCMQRLEKGGVDLAFVDVDLPEVANSGFLGEAGQSERKTFVAAMASPNNMRIFDLAENLKAFEFLIKPLGQDEILAIVGCYRRLAKPKKVLVVDDLPSLRQIIGRILASSVYRLDVEQASDEAGALARLKQGSFDIVFLDWDASDPGGMRLLEEIASRAPKAKIVMVSVEQNSWQERNALRRGAAAVLHKPFYPADVGAILHAICGMDLSKLSSKSGGITNGFDVRIRGRTVIAGRQESGRAYRFLWFRDQPYLRASCVQGYGSNPGTADPLYAEAETAAVAELNRAGLLNAVPPALAG